MCCCTSARTFSASTPGGTRKEIFTALILIVGAVLIWSSYVQGRNIVLTDTSRKHEGIDTTHNPEFTMLECYCAYEDWQYMMDLTERMVRKDAPIATTAQRHPKRARRATRQQMPHRRRSPVRVVDD